MQELEEELRKLVKQSFRTRFSFMATHEGAWHPLTDVYETDREIVIKMEVPGVAMKDLQIVLDGKRLVVQGVRRDPSQERRVAYQQMEISYGRFRREIVLPLAVSTRAARAGYRDGFLEIRIPFADQFSAEYMVINIE